MSFWPKNSNFDLIRPVNNSIIFFLQLTQQWKVRLYSVLPYITSFLLFLSPISPFNLNTPNKTQLNKIGNVFIFYRKYSLFNFTFAWKNVLFCTREKEICTIKKDAFIFLKFWFYYTVPSWNSPTLLQLATLSRVGCIQKCQNKFSDKSWHKF